MNTPPKSPALLAFEAADEDSRRARYAVVEAARAWHRGTGGDDADIALAKAVETLDESLARRQSLKTDTFFERMGWVPVRVLARPRVTAEYTDLSLLDHTPDDPIE